MNDIKQCHTRSRVLATTAFMLAIFAPLSNADSPGRGATAQFVKDCLITIISHHYSALRITELAAGTDEQGDAAVNSPQEGTSPTPGTSAVAAKASADAIKLIARKANRMQRELYGVSHTTELSPEDRQSIPQLEQTPAGAQFGQAF